MHADAVPLVLHRRASRGSGRQHALQVLDDMTKRGNRHQAHVICGTLVGGGLLNADRAVEQAHRWRRIIGLLIRSVM